MKYDHEAAVKAFLDAARLADPEKHAVVCKKYPVKNQFQLDQIYRTELSVGLHPEPRLGQHLVASATEAAFVLTVLEEAS